MSCPPMKFTGKQSVLNPSGNPSNVGKATHAGNVSPVKEKTTSPIEEKTNDTAVRKISR